MQGDVAALSATPFLVKNFTCIDFPPISVFYFLKCGYKNLLLFSLLCKNIVPNLPLCLLIFAPLFSQDLAFGSLV